MTKKFELTKETMTKYGRTFYRIRALIDIKFSWGSVKKGDIGGYIEDEKCLSQDGNAWVFENGMATKDSTIWGGTIRGGEIMGGTIWGGTIMGGTIWGGEIMGGEIRGGTIRGGTIWGGEIMGGEIRGGTIRGGTIRGGTIRSGEIRGGEIRGGTIWGGEIRGGTIWGGTIRGGEIMGGEIIKKDPTYISGLKYQITITNKSIVIGCENHTHEEWNKFNNKRIIEMDGKEALKFWKEHKKMIMNLAKTQKKEN